MLREKIKKQKKNGKRVLALLLAVVTALSMNATGWAASKEAGQNETDGQVQKDHVIFAVDRDGTSKISANGNNVSCDTGVKYEGESSSLKLTAGGGDNSIFLDSFDYTGYNFVEFYVYTKAANTQAGTWWGNDTDLKPGKWTLVRLDLGHEYITLLNDQGQEFCPNKWHKGSPFVGRLVLRFMGSGCKAGTEFWVSSVKGYSTRRANSVATVERAGYASSNAKAEYVTDRTYDDESNTADNLMKATEKGLLKVTVSGGEASVGIWSSQMNDVSMAGQVYFYVYTDARNTKAGGWWCGDTPLTPGKWTKVTLTKEMKPQNWNGKDIFDREIGPRAFAYRFMGGSDGTVFYVTSLYADMPFAKEPVKIITNHCSTDQESYLRGDTVTLTAGPAPEGKTFDYYTVNGVYAGRNGFVVADKESVVDVVYREANVIQSANKAGASGVDGNDSAISFDAKRAHGEEKGAIKVQAGKEDSAIYLDSFDYTGYNFVEFYVYTEAENTMAGTWWGNDTILQPGKWTLVRLDLGHENITLLNDQGQEFCPNKWHKGSPFVGRLVLRFMGSGCKAGTEFWISSVKAYSTRSVNSVAAAKSDGYASSNAKAEYVPDKTYEDESLAADSLVKAAEEGLLKVTVTGNEAAVGIWNSLLSDVSMAKQVYYYVYTEAKNAKAGGWWCGDTPLTPGKWTKVTLTREMKPQNWNGKDIFDPEIGPRAFTYRFMGGSDGTVFYVTSLYADMPFAKEPVEIITNHCTTARAGYLRGDMVTLKAASAPEGKVFDYYTVNGRYVGRNGFVAADKRNVVEAVYRDAHVVQPANKAGASGIDGNGSSISYDAKRAFEDESGSIKVTAGKDDNAIYLDRFNFTGYSAVEFYVYTQAENTQAGTWWGNDTKLQPGKWTRVRLDLGHENITLLNDQGQEFCPNHWQKGHPFVGRLVLRFMGSGCKAGTEFWISSVKAYGSLQVNNVSAVERDGYAASNAKAEYVTEKSYDGTDARVKACDQGALKVTVTGGEAAVGVWNKLPDHIDTASQVYFYVYTDAKNTKAGGWWCGDTPLAPGKWTKVTLTREMKPQNWHMKNIFDSSVQQGGVRGFAYRFMGGTDGTVFYVTSLYAEVPYDTGKTPDPNKGKEMWIGGWDVPNNTYQDYKLAKDMGLTHMFIDCFMARKGTPEYYQQLAYCEQVGLKAIVGMDTNLDNPHNVQTDMYDYSIYPAVDMINLWDEPPMAQFPDVQARVRAMNELYKGKDMTLLINMDPYNCIEQNVGGISGNHATYYWDTEKYLRPYCDTVLKEITGRKILSTTIYPLRKTGIYDIWLDRLSWYAECAKQDNAEVHAFIQAFDGETERPITKKAELSYQIYTDMAFGIKGYTYFTYRKSLLEEIGGGCVDLDGRPTSLYYWAKEINEAVAKFDEVYLSYKWDGVLPLKGTDYSRLQNCLDKIHNPLTRLACASNVTATKDTLVGQFFDDRGKSGLFVSNFSDPLENQWDEVSFTFWGARSAVVYRNGEATVQPVYQNQLKISLAPGEGVFVIPQ